MHITYEDQQKINKFARHNAKLDDLKEELKVKQVNFLSFVVKKKMFSQSPLSVKVGHYLFHVKFLKNHSLQMGRNILHIVFDKFQI